MIKVVLEVEDEDELSTILILVQSAKLISLKEIANNEAEMINEVLINRYNDLIEQLHRQGATSPLDTLEELQ